MEFVGLKAKLKDFWNKVFKSREECKWFDKCYCYKYYPTGYPGMKWKRCKGMCDQFEERKNNRRTSL